MTTYAHTYRVTFFGPEFTGSSVTLTRFSTVENFVDDFVTGPAATYAVNDSISDSGSDSSFSGSDANYMGTINVLGVDYPVFYDSANGANSTYRVLLNSQTASTELRTSLSFASITPTIQPFASCFAEGTLIATPDGEVAVETLKIGDKVMTADGRAVPVVWLGYQDVFPSEVSEEMQPVRVRKDALGQNLPHTDLVLTSDHALALDGYLVDAGALVNGETINYLPLEECGFRLRVFHVETEEHEVLMANGVGAESFLDAPDRASFANYDAYCEIYGEERRVPEMPVPRIPSARLLPTRVRARLKAPRVVPA